MSIIGELRKLSGNKELQWKQGGCPYVIFFLNGVGHTLLRRTLGYGRIGYQLNVEGKQDTPSRITSSWSTILKRLQSKISSQIVK